MQHLKRQLEFPVVRLWVIELLDWVADKSRGVGALLALQLFVWE
jgi:hypothetical protein